jgi:hypothetical protein
MRRVYHPYPLQIQFLAFHLSLRGGRKMTEERGKEGGVWENEAVLGARIEVSR